jgi:TRAP-type mannitol/chloroaromatic compound transport system permease large subunit
VSWLAAHLAPLMLLALIPVVMSGVPVAFGLIACGMAFGAAGIALGVLPAQLMQALHLRLFGIMSNEVLLAIPFFTFMGLILQRSGMAEDLLETVGQVFGPVRGGLALAVVVVGALLAATTGVAAASVISMGLVSLPIMLRNGYDPRLACGVIAASGTLTQVVPPSLVLIVTAFQLGRSVGDMYAAALVPALLVIGLYAAWVALVALVRPRAAPAISLDQRGFREASGRSGHRSLALLTLLSIVAGWGLLQAYPALVRATGREFPPPNDEVVVVGLVSVVLSALVLALLDTIFRLHLLSALARRAAFVLAPPLILIFLVLGSTYLGVATPTESGAMGASGAMALSALRRRLTVRDTAQALLSTSKLSCVVMLLMFAATVFSLSFQALEGDIWVENLLAALPGGQVGFLIFVTALVFVLGCFLDFFEIAIVLLPLLAPIAEKLGIDLIWFGVLVGINLQTSFLTPPFGFALLFLRSVAPRTVQLDPQTERMLPGISTGDIYRGALPFVAVQVLVMALIIAFPDLVSGGMHKAKPVVDEAAVARSLREMGGRRPAEIPPDPVLLLLESIGQQR